MNALQSRNEKINVHEELKANGEIFERDILGRRELAKRILNRLLDGGCPYALGIYGGWGTGKTSLLNLIKQLNEPVPGGKPSPIQLVSIDAWEHESAEGLLIPVVVELDEIKGADVEGSHLGIVVKRALFASGMFVADALLKKYANLELEQIQKAAADASAHDNGIAYEAILENWRTRAKEISKTKDAFAALINSALVNKNKDKIVICIDNLDRCSPENVVRLLESVKVFFNVPGCTWVFAVDSEVIASYINHKYEGTRMDGNSYLDKIIPEQYHLSLSPTSDREKIVNLLRFAAGTDRLELNEKNIPQLPRVLVPRRLIKSAAKLSEFYRQGNQDITRASKALVFSLALLYHAWPEFYQRFSSASEEHIRWILDNFFPPEKSSTQTKEASANESLLPLLKDYVEDRDLSYFIQKAFGEYRRSRDTFISQLIDGISGLRKTGLP